MNPYLVDWIIKIKPLISQILFFICFYDIYIATSGLQRYYPLRKYIHCKILHILNINIKQIKVIDTTHKLYIGKFLCDIQGDSYVHNISTLFFF